MLPEAHVVAVVWCQLQSWRTDISGTIKFIFNFLEVLKALIYRFLRGNH